MESQFEDLYKKYVEENSRRLERALVAFANIALLGIALFVLDRLSDWTCDWWLKTCKDLSSLMFFAYLGIFIYIGWFAYKLTNTRGKLAALAAGGEMWKEIVRLCGVYGELASNLQLKNIP